MTNKARIIDDVAIDVTDGDPALIYGPELAGQFEAVPDEVRPQWRRDGETWSPPPEPAPAASAPARLLQVSPPAFKLLFTSAERLAIRAARAYAGADEQALTAKAVIDDWFDIVDDPRLTVVDLALPATVAGLEFLVALGILTQERCDEILGGVAT